MGRSFALILAAAAVVGASASAHAADLLPPPPPIEAPPPPVDFGGWYLRGDVGVGVNQLTNLRSTFDPTVVVPMPLFNQYSIGDAAFAGAGVGYQFNSWFRADVTGEYRTAANYRATQSYTDIWSAPGFSPCGIGARCHDTYNGQHSAAVFLANGYFDLGTWYGITPYVGGGIGFAVNWLQNVNDFSAQPAGGFGYASDTNRTNFAWAVMAGLAYNVTPNLKLEVGYRYLDMGTINTNPIYCQGVAVCPRERQSFDLASHDIRLGFRYMLGGFAPAPVLAPPPGPLVRKY
ncbi:outer membrane beta-barrel protein [Methylocystis sp. WRRC1]|uniref:outer membrane protein n=1 Tax=unclassified Methylocystis TaxID=2625913 RepID=UPI0001F87A79|nr:MULTISPECIES: outer membrane beta-barrel protein [unclassified Methylocystis]MCC3243725.1 outer membrane beta-barrel protein [Methylocystis sp. WRRC1]